MESHYADTFGNVISINGYSNNSGYGYLKTSQYIYKYEDGTYMKVGAEFIESKGKSVYFTKRYDENGNFFDKWGYFNSIDFSKIEK